MWQIDIIRSCFLTSQLFFSYSPAMLNFLKMLESNSNTDSTLLKITVFAPMEELDQVDGQR